MKRTPIILLQSGQNSDLKKEKYWTVGKNSDRKGRGANDVKIDVLRYQLCVGVGMRMESNKEQIPCKYGHMHFICTC